MTFGRKLQDLRRQRGMSQDVLAEQLGVSRQAVSKWERDESMPDTENVVRLAGIFEVSLDWLLLDREEVLIENSGGRDGKSNGRLAYWLLGIGGVICLLSVLMWLIWPGVAGKIYGEKNLEKSFYNAYEHNPMVVIVDGERQAIETVPDWFLAQKMEEQGYSQEELTVQTPLGRMVEIQAKLCLIALVPGMALLLAAILVLRAKKAVK